MFRPLRFFYDRLFRPRKLDHDMRDEFEFHLAARTADLERGGLPHAAALRRARLEFGGLSNFEEETREGRWAAGLHTLFRDVRYALRSLRRSPGFATVAALTLGLGIGANTAIFSVADAVLIRRLPYPQADRLVLVWETEGDFRTAPVTGPDYRDWVAQQTVFDQMGAGTESHITLTGSSSPRQVDGEAVTPEILPMLGGRPQLGRSFAASDMGEGRDRVTILSHKLWQQSFGSDPQIVGRTVYFDRVPYTVIGVLAKDFRPPGVWIRDPQFWIPTPLYGELNQARGNHWLWVLGRLKPGVSVAQAQAAMGGLAAGLRAQFPTSNGEVDANVMPLQSYLVTDVRDVLAMLLGAAAFILAIACANVANLVMAYAVRRRDEITVRKALGARPRRIVAQMLIESLVLSAIGTVAGLGLGVALKTLLTRLAPAGYLPGFNPPEFNLRLFSFAAGLAVVTGMVFGIFPALQARKSGAAEALNRAGRSIAAGGKRLRQALIVIEIATAMALLFSAGIAVHSLYRLLTQDLGFQPDHLLTLSLSLSKERYSDPARAAAFYRRLTDRARALPGVAAVGVTSELPLQGFRNGVVWIEGQPEPRGLGGPLVSSAFVSAGYLATIRNPVIRGRGLSQNDAASSSPPVAIANEAMANRFWPRGDAVGKRFSFEWGSGHANWIEIVGVARDVRQYGMRKPAIPGVYVLLPDNEALPQMSLVVRSSGPGGSLPNLLASAVHELDPDLPVDHLSWMSEIVSTSASATRYDSDLLALFGALALLLAGAGVFGVMSCLVAQRTHEIGVRVALGATSLQVLQETLREAAVLIALGLLAGVALSSLAARALRTVIFGVGPHDPMAYIAAVAGLVACGMLAAYLPARRASRVDPMVALRYE